MFLDFKTRLIGIKKPFNYSKKLVLYSHGSAVNQTKRSGTMSDYRDRRKAKQLAKNFRFIPSVARSAVKAEKLARLHAYDLDPDTYGGHCGFVTTHSGRAQKPSGTRANNSRARSVPESRALPPIPAKPFREYWAYVGRYTATTEERPICTVWLPPMV